MNNYSFLVAGLIAMLMSATYNPFGISFVFSEIGSNYLLQVVNNTIFVTNPDANETVIIFNTTYPEVVNSFAPNVNLSLVDKFDPTVVGENDTIFIYNATDEMGLEAFTVPPINEVRSGGRYAVDPAVVMAMKIDDVGLCKSNLLALEAYCKTLIPLN